LAAAVPALATPFQTSAVARAVIGGRSATATAAAITRGMVTKRVVAAFASVGWGWGGARSGNTKDDMHFSINGQ
jgi:hypothetical protein